MVVIKMKNFNFHEKQDIENMMMNGHVDDNYKITIGKLALYNYAILGMKKEDNYDAIKMYMSLNAKDFFEAEYQKVIYQEITNAKRRILRDIHSVCITYDELERIAALNDERKEKIAFILIATTKYYDGIKGIYEHYTNLTNAEMCKMARVNIRSSMRDQFMTFLYDDGIVERHVRPNSSGKRVLFVSDDGDTCLELFEIDFTELAYTYLSWKYPDDFVRCKVCGKVIKKNKNNTKIYCDDCKYDVKREQDKLLYDKRKNSER